MSLLVISEILGLFVNTLTADDKHSCRNSKNLRQPIQMQWSKKDETFFEFFASFLKLSSVFQIFEKKITLIAYESLKLRTANVVVREISRKLRPRTPSNSEHVNMCQTLMNYVRHNFCDILSSLSENWVTKVSLLVISEILWLFD